MTMNNQQDGTNLTIAIEGRVDTQTAPQLEENIKNSIEGLISHRLDISHPQDFVRFWRLRTGWTLKEDPW